MLTEETITVEECVYKISKVLILEYKIPKEFITNCDKLFMFKYQNIFLAKLGVKKKLLTSFYLEINSQIERINQTLEQYLRMYANKL